MLEPGVKCNREIVVRHLLLKSVKSEKQTKKIWLKLTL